MVALGLGIAVVRSWLSYRMRSGAGRKSSPLDDIRPERWTSQLTEELRELLWVLEATVAMFPALAELLESVVASSSGDPVWPSATATLSSWQPTSSDPWWPSSDGTVLASRLIY